MVVAAMVCYSDYEDMAGNTRQDRHHQIIIEMESTLVCQTPSDSFYVVTIRKKITLATKLRV